MDVKTLAKITGATLADAGKYFSPLMETMERFAIVTREQKAAFLATIAVESQNLSHVEESLYYRDAERLARIYPRAFKTAAQAAPYTRNSAALSKLLYGGLHGRGLIQLTWAENYFKAGQDLGFDYMAQPTLLLEPWHAAMVSGWYWHDREINRPAARGDMVTVTRLVNGKALMHLSERTSYYNKAMAILK